ncbi:MAG: hypothetical protein AAF961_12580, partial [Planctomycetota bacterium]
MISAGDQERMTWVEGRMLRFVDSVLPSSGSVRGRSGNRRGRLGPRSPMQLKNTPSIYHIAAAAGRRRRRNDLGTLTLHN